MLTNLTELCIAPNSSIRHAITCIDRNETGIALITDQERRLLGTITDGDVRRAMLAGDSLDTPIRELLDRKKESPYPEPVTVSLDAEPAAVLQLMQERLVRQVPVLDKNKRVVGLITRDELLPDEPLPLQAVIMAGGFGSRLRPLTDNLPKPMLPVGDRPLMERMIRHLHHLGIRQVNITTHYHPEKIVEHFGDGRAFGVKLNYVNEDRPLGTGGALGLIPLPEEPILVINGDILTQVDFRAMLTYHREHQAEMTVAVRRFDFQVPYGVVECSGARVNRLREKPQLGFLVNAGIYLLEPTVYQHIPNGEHFHMTELIQRLVDADQMVVSFLIHEYWLDIGQHTDYLQAQEDVQTGRLQS